VDLYSYRLWGGNRLIIKNETWQIYNFIALLVTGLHKMLRMVSVHIEPFGHNTVCLWMLQPTLQGNCSSLVQCLFQFEISAWFVYNCPVPFSGSCRNKSSEIIFRNWDGRSFCSLLLLIYGFLQVSRCIE